MADRDRQRTLDDEGIPDLQGPLPGKAATGDPQEGDPPPSDKPASFDWGTTERDEREGEPLSVRVTHEVPDVDERPISESNDRIQLVSPEDEDVGIADDEPDLVGRAVDPDLEGVSAEEDAVHISKAARGANLDDDPGYVDR